MTYVRLSLLACCLVLPVVATAQTTPKSPEQQATETMLLTEVTAHRDWQAKAIELQAKVIDLEKQLAEKSSVKKTP